MRTAETYIFYSGIANGVGVGICLAGFLYSLPLLPLLLLALLLFILGLALAAKGGRF